MWVASLRTEGRDKTEASTERSPWHELGRRQLVLGITRTLLQALQKAESAHYCCFGGDAEEAQGSSWLVIKGSIRPGEQSFYL